jgi:hypothetical protein
MNFEAIIPNRKIIPLVTPGVIAIQLDGQVHANMVVFALTEWKRTKGKSYFHVYYTNENGYVEVSDGDKLVLTYKVGEMRGITERIYAIVDDHGEEGLTVTLLLPSEY